MWMVTRMMLISEHLSLALPRESMKSLKQRTTGGMSISHTEVEREGHTLTVRTGHIRIHLRGQKIQGGYYSYRNYALL